jgi:hypothetical protein
MSDENSNVPKVARIALSKENFAFLMMVNLRTLKHFNE